MNKLKLLILDVDGILTDGKKYYDKSGMPQLKIFCDKDWTTIKRFKAIGVEVIFLTGDPFNEEIGIKRNIPVIVNRKDGYHKDKSDYLDELCKKYNCELNEVVYYGDDLFDIGIMEKLQYSFCTKDSPQMVKDYARVVDINGGENAVLHLYEKCEDMELIERFTYDEIMGKIYELDTKEIF
tara:strand:+ start:259 stop:801 length:543 start_codon:yes stop_codon:yes gene_type:complete